MIRPVHFAFLIALCAIQELDAASLRPWIVSATKGRASKPKNADYQSVVATMSPIATYTKPPPTESRIPKGQTPIQGQIIGGMNAVQKQIPWHCTNIIDDSMLCGATIISSNYLVSAGHCLLDNYSFRLTCGGVNRSASEPYEVTKTTTLQYIHPDYDPKTYNNDFGVLRVRSGFSFNSYVRPIRLPSMSDVFRSFTDYTVTIVGYGKTESGGSVSRILKYAYVPVISSEESKSYFGSKVIIDSTICTKAGDGYASICQGDSGSGLVIKEPDGKYTLLGIHSFVPSVGCANGPNCHVNVAFYLRFIKEVTGVIFREFSSHDNE